MREQGQQTQNSGNFYEKASAGKSGERLAMVGWNGEFCVLQFERF